MLTLDAVSFSYPGRERALRDITLSLSPGITLLAGPNAGGKTTLLRLLSGLFECDSGDIRQTDPGTKVDAPSLRRLSRMVMQDADPQIFGATVREDIELGRAASELPGDFGQAAQDLSEKFGLLKLWNEPVETLSYGQKRKLCLVHALLAGPRMLLLDEPFAGLDYPAAVELREFIRDNARSGLTQVISTHELEPVFDLADHLVVIGGGCVLASGVPNVLAPDLEQWSVRAPGRGWR